MKKIMALVLAAMMLLACCSALAEAPEGYPEVKEGIDFGGKDIYIYNYWDSADWTERYAKLDQTDEIVAQTEYRHWLEKTYNCTLHEIARGDWGSCGQEMQDFVGNGGEDDKLAIFVVEPGKVAGLLGGGYAAAWDYDLSGEKWNASDIEFMTVKGKVYGAYAGNSEPRQCLFFNKDLLEKYGVDWNAIYDMQKDGTWTWDAYEEILKKMTLDTDGDGVIDVWGVTGSGDDLYACAVFGNGGSYFDYDADGNLVPTMGSDEALEGFAYGKKIMDSYFYKQPEGANWDYFKEAFKAGNIAFYQYQTYGGFNENSELSDTPFKWGCVAFPAPKEGMPYKTIISDNIAMLPNCYDAETLQKLAFIYDMWTNATPGYDDEYGWIGNKYNFTDERAVDETYAMLREPEHCAPNRVLLLGTQNDVLGNSLLWALGGSEASDLIEAGMPAWQALCDDFNK